MALSVSARVSIIDELAKRLSNEEWSLIDLTLSQFGQPTTDTWNGEKYDYVIEMTKNAAEDELIAIAHHVGVSIETPKAGVDPPFWENGHLRVFISHLAANKRTAGNLQAAMSEYYMSGFVAHNDIEPTKEWQDEIETALETCDAMVVLLHKGFGDSDWTDQEVGFAMGRHIPILTVRYDEDPHGFIGRFQAFKGRGKSADALAIELFDALVASKQAKARMEDILVQMFEDSYNFQNAKDNMSRLEAVEQWQHDYSERIKKALKTNSQVSNAWGVPERAKALIKKWNDGGA
ncbi:MAG: toll/interleukin-1 receptor domain-containing protein [Pseudomonadota bacterium]